jgi:hypothetical protein
MYGTVRLGSEFKSHPQLGGLNTKQLPGFFIRIFAVDRGPIGLLTLGAKINLILLSIKPAQFLHGHFGRIK